MRRPWRGSAMRRFAADRDTLAAIFDRPDNIPLIARRGARVFNFWKDAEHPARAVARDNARQLPQRDAGLGHPARPRRARGTGGRRLDVERGRDDPGQSRPRHSDAVARRRRCRGAARIRPCRARFRLRRVSLCRRPRAGPPGSIATHCCCPRPLGEGMATSSGYARTVRLWRRGSRPADRPGHLRDEMPTTWRSGPMSTATARPRSVLVFVERLGFFDADRLDRRPHRTQDPASTCRPMRRSRGIAAGSRSSGAPPGRSTAKPIRRTPSSASPSRPSSPATAILQSCSSRPSAAPCRGSSGAAAGFILSILDDLKPVFEALTPSDTGWSRERITGLPDIRRRQCLAARCADRRVRTAICSPARRTR